MFNIDCSNNHFKNQMLTPEQILAISERAEEIAGQIHSYLISQIVKRMMIRLERGDEHLLTATDKWRLETLRDAGFFLADLQAELATLTALGNQEIKDAFEYAGITSFDYDTAVFQTVQKPKVDFLQSSDFYKAIMERNYKKTLGTWQNYVGTTANAAQTEYINACDKAYNLTITGGASLGEAVNQAVREVAERQLYINYPTGHKDTIETAVARAVRTGCAQGCAEITEDRIKQEQWDIILVSAHLGARYGDGGENETNHYWWQGQFYSRSGNDERFKPFSVTGYGTLLGLCGVNCRHSFAPGDGVNNPFIHFDSDENKKAYDLSQRQRYMERTIRKQKRIVAALNTALQNGADDKTEQLYQRKAFQLQSWNQRYNAFCQANNLKKQYDRLKIAEWNRAEAAKASAAARKYSKQINGNA